MENVIEESVLLIPQTGSFIAKMIDRAGNVQEVLPEFTRNAFVNGVVHGQLACDSEHVQAVTGHPTRAVGLLHMATGRQWRTAVEDANVVQP